MRTDGRAIVACLKRAAHNGSTSAAFILGRLYDEGWGVSVSARTAFRWYKKAADAGLSDAFYFVGSSYHLGHGVRPDGRHAFAWFRRARQSRDLTAAYMEGLCLLEGKGVRRDIRLGRQLLRQTAGQGSMHAMDYLAAFYIKQGRLKVAKAWAEKAVAAGDDCAPARLRQIDELTTKHGKRRSKRSGRAEGVRV